MWKSGNLYDVTADSKEAALVHSLGKHKGKPATICCM